MRWFRLAFAAIATIVSSSAVQGQASVRLIDDPLPQELKERTAELLRIVRPNEANEGLANARIIDDAGWRNHRILILRIETGCDQEFCMTMITRVSDLAIEPELILQAGRAVLFNDVGQNLWGDRNSSFPILFEGKAGSALAAWDRDGRWVVEACGGRCGEQFGEIVKGASKPLRPPSISPSSAPPRPMTFDEFRRSLALDQ